jgi:hypothetical protein
MFSRRSIILIICILQLLAYQSAGIPIRKRDQAGILRPITTHEERLFLSSNPRNYRQILGEIPVSTLIEVFHSGISIEEQGILTSILPLRKRRALAESLSEDEVRRVPIRLTEQPPDMEPRHMLFLQAILSYLDDNPLIELFQRLFAAEFARNGLLVLVDRTRLEMLLDELSDNKFLEVFESMTTQQKSQLMSKMTPKHIQLLHELLQQHHFDFLTQNQAQEEPSSPESVPDLVSVASQDFEGPFDENAFDNFNPMQEPREDGSEPTTPRDAMLPNPLDRTPPNAPTRPRVRNRAGRQFDIPPFGAHFQPFH